ncbi:pimeloyl-ACP methyl ester carboxylesterase [Agrobacterium vitis]|nr:pimeloyl-ACP methyl ester carboxylesterase [Agrobacterium vitis]MBE1436855.1 pimeloyl-ACP methyl ester carboxylesterase [Agrobacterium vitis]
MNWITLTASIALPLLIGSFVYGQILAAGLTKQHPPIGQHIALGDMTLHALHVAAGDAADLPALVFIHGASGNLLDQTTAFLPHLKGRGELLFVDRPGHGYSERGGAANDAPDGQAHTIARAMDAVGIDSAIIVGHSFGGAVAASFAVLHPEKTKGLLLLAPATHPWPGGVDWHYNLTATPVIGPIFAHTIAPIAGMMRMESAISAVFAPNPKPAEYSAKAAPTLVLRPASFRYNAIDVTNLHGYVSQMALRYPEIKVPTVIITGDSDDIVLANVHSVGLARDIEGAELVWLRHVGHKPDYVATDLAIAALEKIAGRTRDLQAIAASTP